MTTMTSSKPYWYLHLSQLPFLMALHFEGEDIEFDLDQWAMYAIKISSDEIIYHFDTGQTLL